MWPGPYPRQHRARVERTDVSAPYSVECDVTVLTSESTHHPRDSESLDPAAPFSSGWDIDMKKSGVCQYGMWGGGWGAYWNDHRNMTIDEQLGSCRERQKF